MEKKKSFYVHGSDPEEQRRLSLLNQILNAQSLRMMSPQPGDRVLDVGCGLAQLSRGVARAVGEMGVVVGVERDPDQLREARAKAEAVGEESLVDLRGGDALSLPLSKEEWGSFDVAHARFVLEHVPEPVEVVRSMLRALKPGGRIILEDDDHDRLRIWPEPENFSALWNAYQGTYYHHGNDPLVGRRLVSLIVEAGGEPARNRWLFFGSCAGNPDFDMYVVNLLGIFKGARESMQTFGGLDPGHYEKGMRDLENWGKRPDATLWYATSWAEGRRRSG